MKQTEGIGLGCKCIFCINIKLSDSALIAGKGTSPVDQIKPKLEVLKNVKCA